MRPIEATRDEFIERAAALAEARCDEAGRRLVRQFVTALYRRTPPADIAARDPALLSAAACGLLQFAAIRLPRRALIRAYNPIPEQGWAAPATIVEIVSDDMSFLVDSVSAAIAGAGYDVRLAIHPVLHVVRDAAGRIVELDPAAPAESWMQIELPREPDAARRDLLTTAIAGVLADVRAAVADWPAMRETVQAFAAGLASEPAGLPAEERHEAADFLRWLDRANFTFLGFRDYPADPAAAAERPALGLLCDPDYPVFGALRDIAGLPPDIQDYVQRREPLIITKSNRRATVHRDARMDAVGVRRFGPDGAVAGVGLFIGLLTADAYRIDPRTIPLVRRKVAAVAARAGFDPAAHDGRALAHILDTFPRDELLQIGEDELFDTAIGILNLQQRRRIALFVRRDPFGRFVSCLVYAPRDRYDSRLRGTFADILEGGFAGQLLDFYVRIDDSPLARAQFVIRIERGTPAADVAALEARLVEAGRGWSDRVEAAAIAALGEAAAGERLRAYRSFPAAYQAHTAPLQAVADLDQIEAVLAGAPLAASLHPREEGGYGLRLYRRGEPVSLSAVLPILENLGLRVIAEEPFRLDKIDGAAVWVHEFMFAEGAIPREPPAATRRLFETALIAAWTGEIENDGFNRLVLAAGLSARQVVILRLYCKFLRQAGSSFSQAYMEDTLAGHADIARRLVRLFEHRFDPAADPASLDSLAEVQAIDHELDAVESLDEDRILRNYMTLILRTVRTNYYQHGADGGVKPHLAVKLASHALDLLPLPRPHFEIFVYSPRVEGVHMRAGMVARGGIRWSDRREDFRTEILGLMKAQTVKNAVIVPVGSKGGFVVKQPTATRDQFLAEGIECYRILMHGLLDLTDNIVAEGGRRIVPPREVVRHDGDDPYLVVAADKGTATFSDTANAISGEYGFWLGDAFASGGSAGYDHKAIGITSRGAWELIKRHFRELGRDIQAEDFTVVGVGDMSGDVFGNGMLRSRHIRLVAAFSHMHVFTDPNPDAAASYAERERLAALPRSSWADYDPRLISAGGGVFERSLKSIPISAEMKAAFGIAEDHLTPAELIRKLLGAEIDLLFFGGIGTFVKAADETHAAVGDRANDALRIDGEAIRAKVVGEGANLGVTQRGRIAYALAGGRIDTDAIDNSAGVSMSDHEVNIKILLGHAIAAGTLDAPQREPLLAAMTDDVAALVLRDNYLQGQALSLAEARGPAMLDRHARLIRELEKAGRLDRALEFLPDDDTLAERAAARRGLTRPELAILLAYAKMALDGELQASDVPDLPELGAELQAYFPPQLRDRFAAEIAAHPLRREIVATVVTNDLINRAGLTFIPDMRARTGRPAAEVTRAYRIVREVYALPPLWAAIEALDGVAPAAVQYDMLLDIAGVVEHAAAWLLRRNRIDIGAETARFAAAVAQLAAAITGLLPPAERAVFDAREARLAAAGVPGAVAAQAAGSVFLTTALEVADLAARASRPIETAARAFYGVGARFALDDMRAAARRLPAETAWQKAAAETVIDDFYALQADLAERILRQSDGAADPLAAWLDTRAAQLAPAEAIAADLRAAASPDLAMLVVAGRQLRQAVG